MNRLADTRRMEALRDEISHTRTDLGDTVQALTSKMDVRNRARAGAQRAADRIGTGGRGAGPWLLLAAGAVAAVAAVLVVRRRADAAQRDEWTDQTGGRR